MDILDGVMAGFLALWGFLGIAAAIRLRTVGRPITARLLVSWMQVVFLTAYFWSLHHRELRERFPFPEAALWIGWGVCAAYTVGPTLLGRKSAQKTPE